MNESLCLIHSSWIHIFQLTSDKSIISAEMNEKRDILSQIMMWSNPAFSCLISDPLFLTKSAKHARLSSHVLHTLSCFWTTHSKKVQYWTDFWLSHQFYASLNTCAAAGGIKRGQGSVCSSGTCLRAPWHTSGGLQRSEVCQLSKSQWKFHSYSSLCLWWYSPVDPASLTSWDICGHERRVRWTLNLYSLPVCMWSVQQYVDAFFSGTPGNFLPTLQPSKIWLFHSMTVTNIKDAQKAL